MEQKVFRNPFQNKEWCVRVPRNRKRKDPLDEFFGESLFQDMKKMFEGLEGGRSETGYSIQVTQGPEGTEVHAKAGKNMDVTSLRNQLQQQYPDAQIHIEGGKPLIREISTTPTKSKKEEKEERSTNKEVEIKIE